MFVKLRENLTSGIRKSFTPPILNTDNQRIRFIDLAKGVCILLVIAVHVPNLNLQIPGLNALRMPLYFLLSGLFFKQYGGFTNFVEKKTNKILIPFLFFFFIDLLHHAVLIKSIEFSHFIAPITDNLALRNRPLWFLFALFWSNIVFYIIVTGAQKIWQQAITIVLISALAFMFARNEIYLPYWFLQGLFGLPYFFLGYIIKRTPLLYPNKFDKYSLPLATIFLSLAIGICLFKGFTPQLDFLYSKFIGNPIEIFIVSTLMVSGTLMLCKAIKWLPIISYMGRYSIILLVLHYPLIIFLNPILYKLGFERLDPRLVYMCVVIICWFAIPLLISYIPYFIAQKDLLRISNSKKFKLENETTSINNN